MIQLDPEKRILDLPLPLDAEAMTQALDILDARYPLLERASLGTSMLGRPLPLLRMGTGRPAFCLVGGISGCDPLSPALLCRFVNEFCDLHARRSRIFGCNLGYLTELRSICVVPMLNPDGNAYALHGVSADHLLHDRLLTMNRGSEDFSGWQANARGVDLSQNFAASPDEFAQRKQDALQNEQLGIPGGGVAGWCGEAPESEPESAALTRHLRCAGDTGLLLALRPGATTQLILSDHANKQITTLATRLARLVGIPMVTADDAIPLCDWATEEMGIPALTLELDAGKRMIEAYTTVREMLFVAPTLTGR